MHLKKFKFKVGVIGLGHQSIEDHIPAIKACNEAELVAVVDINKDRLDSFIAENKGIRGYDSVDSLFQKEKLDFIVLATPHCMHCEIMKKAINKKIHILKEKPFAISLVEAREIDELAKKNNIHIMVTLQRRFNPIYVSFFQLIDKIGKPFFIESKYTFFSNSPHSGWRGDKKLAGGGCIIDMGYHIIDLLMWFFGLPDVVLANMICSTYEDHDHNVEDTASIVFKYFDSEIFGSLIISRVMHPKQEFFNVYGEKGMIHLERGKIERYKSNGELIESLERQQQWPSAAQDQIEYFLKVISGERKNIGEPKTHFDHLAFIEAAYASEKSQKYINPKNIIK